MGGIKMGNNLEVNNSNNEILVDGELLCAFELEQFNKKYVIYQKDEIDVNNNVTIYVMELINENGQDVLKSIDNDLEWTKIKEIIKEMSKYAEEGAK